MPTPNLSCPIDTIRGTGAREFSGLGISLVFITVGLALLANALWPLVLLPVVIVIVRWTVIDHEERYLTAKFGEEYLQYKARVQRWM